MTSIVSSRPQPTRWQPLLLAVVLSLVAVIVAVALHVTLGVGELPLVVATLVVASFAGWANLQPRRHR